MASAPWFKFFGRHHTFFDNMTDEQAGRVIKAAVRYFNTGEIPPLMDQIETITFSVLKEDIDQSIEDYQVICDRNKANGQKGGRPSRKQVDSRVEPDEEFEGKRKEAVQRLMNYKPP